MENGEKRLGKERGETSHKVIKEYEADGKRYAVERSFVGQKDINEIIVEQAFWRARKESGLI